MLLNVPNVKHQDINGSQVCLSIAQMVSFNAKKQSFCGKKQQALQRKGATSSSLQWVMYPYTHKMQHIMNILYRLGISVSYDRAINKKLVCPANLT